MVCWSPTKDVKNVLKSIFILTFLKFGIATITQDENKRPIIGNTFPSDILTAGKLRNPVCNTKGYIFLQNLKFDT